MSNFSFPVKPLPNLSFALLSFAGNTVVSEVVSGGWAVCFIIVLFRLWPPSRLGTKVPRFSGPGPRHSTTMARSVATNQVAPPTPPEDAHHWRRSCCAEASSPHWHGALAKPPGQPIGKGSRFKNDPLRAKRMLLEHIKQSLRITPGLALRQYRAGLIHHAETRLFLRYVKSNILFHGHSPC